MNLVRVGAAFRAVRVARRLRIRDVAAKSGLSPSVISRMERGEGEQTPVSTYERLAAELGASLDLYVRWHGADLDRMINGAHAALHERVARVVASLPDWQALPEVSFSIYGERGVIDWLLWHAPTRSLLVIELKSALVDVQALLSQVDRYVRLAPQIASGHGWRPASISSWVLFDDTSTNRRAVAAHSSVFGHVFSADGHRMRPWLARPAGQIRALSFLSNGRPTAARPKRVRLSRAAGRQPRTNPRLHGLAGRPGPG